MVDFNDRRPWGFTSPGDADWEAPLDRRSKKAANQRLRSEDLSDHFEVGFSLVNRAISQANRAARRSGNPHESVGDYMNAVHERLVPLVYKHAYKRDA